MTEKSHLEDEIKMLSSTVSDLATQLEAKEHTETQISKDVEDDDVSDELTDSVSIVKSQLKESEPPKRYLTVV